MSWQSKSAAVAIAIMAMSLHSSSVQAMPEQGKVVAGQGEIARPDDKTMVINQKTDRLALDWQKFNIAKDEKVHFDQNSKSAIAINRVVGDGRSIIDGSLSATGNVFVINPNGVLFGKNSSVDVGGLVASTANVTDDDLKNFTQGKGDLGLQIAAGREASVINAGTIKAEGGLVALHATTVENTGTIANEGGTTALAAAKSLNIAADTAGKLNFTVNGSLANAKALNSGMLQSDGGYIVMTAKSAGDVMSTVVNNTGIIEAKTLHTNDKGEILLDGGASGQVEVSGTLNASGMEAGQSAGSIKVIGQKTIINDGTNLLARGTIDGGKIETSGDVLNLGENFNIDAKGKNGKAGEWLLDPLNVYIADDDPTTAYDATKIDIKKYESDNSLSSNTSINYHDPTSKDTADASAVSSAITWIKTKTITDLLNKGTDVTIQAIATNGVANITVNSPIKKEAGADATFTLDAMRNITINKAITSTSGKLNVLLNSDTDGNKIGAVIINADIDTNGGNFISSSGGDLVYSPNKGNETTKGYDKGSIKTGTGPKSDGSTVGTYFGNVNANFVADGSKANRYIKTKGGDITLNGEVAIGLNGGILTLDSSGKDTNGAVNVTGIINSGNSYATYIYGTDEWENLINNSGLVDEYLEAGTVPSYHYKSVNYVKNSDGSYKVDANGNYETTTASQKIDGPHYTYAEANTEDPRWTGSGKGYSTTAGDGWTAVEVTETSVADSMTVKEFLVYYKTAAAANYTSKYNTFDPSKYNDNASLVAALKNDTTTMPNGKTMYENLKADINDLLSVNWFVAKNLAKGETGNGSAVGDTYLATLTTVLENSLTAPNSATALFVGARGSGVLHKTGGTNPNEMQLPYSYYGLPDDPLYSNGMYWVTGPEGLENNGKGTQFYSNIGSDWSKVTAQKTYNSGSNIYGFVNWQTWTVSGVTRTQPDNSGPFLTVGYGTQNQWDDIAMAGGYGGDSNSWAKGFVQEKNLQHSSLNVQAGNNAVKLQGNIGGSEALDTVNIQTTGDVTLGGASADVTKYGQGSINADHGVYVSGKDVTIGGEIVTGKDVTLDTLSKITDTNAAFQKDNVVINAAGNLTVHGIDAEGYSGNTDGGKIKLTSTSDSGAITLGKGLSNTGETTEGTIKAASTEKGAVVIDAQGSQGSLLNNTTGSFAITTGTDGTWQVYVNSPSDYGTSLGTNLKSGTNAQWTATSNTNTTVTTNSSDKKLTDYNDTSNNKFIFQVTPVITISGGNQRKTYGETLTDDKLKGLLTTSVAYTDSNKNTIYVTKFSDNFKEDDYLNYISNSDGTTTGINSISATSDAAYATATRTDGDEKISGTEDYKTASDGNRAFYVFKVDKNGATALNGYDLETVNGDIEILKRKVIVNENGHITYGSADGITYDAPTSEEATSTTGLANEDTIDSVTMIPSTAYQMSQGTRNTADAGTYDLTTDGTKTTILNKGTDVSANYDISGSGTLTVDKATLTLDTGSTSKTYGDATGVNNFLTDKQTNYTLSGFVNGDQDDSNTQSTIRSQITSVTNTSAALVDDTHTNNVLDGGNSGYAITTKVTQSDDLKNYNVVAKQGNTVTLTPVKVTINGGMTQIYGNTAETEKNPTVMIDGKEVTELVNGDTLGNVSYEIQSNGKYNTSKGNRTTADAGTYSGEWLTTGAEISHNELVDKLGTNATGNYIITGSGDITVDKAKLTVDAKDITETYGDAAGVLKDATTAYEVRGFVNGDDDEAKKNALENQITVTMDATDALKDNNQHTKDVNTKGYTNKVVSAIGNLMNGELNNYTVTVGNTGKVYLDPAEVHLKLNDVSTTYGTAFDTDKYGYDASKLAMANGDDASVVTGAITNKDISYNNTGAKTDATNNDVKTQDAGTGYKLTGTTTKTLNNYTITIDGADATVNKANLVVDTKGNTRTYGDVSNVASDVANAASFHVSDSTDTTVNGDTEADILKELGLSTSSDAQVTDDAGNVVKTGDANTDPGYDIKAKFNTDLTNYTVSEGTVGKEKIEKAALVVDTKGNTRTYGDVSNVASDVANAASFHISGSTNTTANGDTEADILKELGLSTSSNAQVTDDAGNVVKTGDANTDPGYDIKAKFNTNLTNYTVSEGTVGKEKIEKAALVVDTKGDTRTYGDVTGVASDVANAASFHVSGSTDTTVNGDSYDDILEEMNLSTDSKAQVKDDAGNVIKTGNANTDPGYDIKADFKTDLKNYTVSEGTVGKEKIEKAALVVDTTGNTRTYGDVTGVASDVANAASFHVSGSTDTTVNGDSYDDILKEMNLSTDSKAQVKDDAGNVVKTGNANTDPGYDIDALFEKDLTNYTVTKGVVGKEKIEKATLNLANGSYTVTYGEVDTVNDKLAHATTITGFQNGDTTESLKDELKLVNTSKGEAGALLDDVRTNDVDTYNIHTDFNPDMTNYNVVLTTPGTITLTPKPITVKNTMTQQYGSSEKTFAEATVSADQLANGDTISTKDLKFDIVSGGKYEQSLKENQAEHADAVSADAGTYTGELVHTGGGITHADGTDAYKNYIVTVEGDIVVTPADLTVKINDASTQYGTPFDEESGKKSYDYTVVSGNANGDTTAEVKDLLGQLKDYKNAGVGDNGRATQDVGSYGITGEQANTLKNYTVKIEDGMATITKAPLTITTGDGKIDYGTDYATTVGKTISRVTGLTNGDKDTDISYNYGNYGGGYIEDNTKTNNVGDYGFTTVVGNKSGDFLKNYEITGGDATLTITPKDVYFHVDGNGNTLADIVYTTTDPNHPSSSNPINGQLVYGETVTPSYRPDGLLPNGHYGVSTSLDGKTISDKDVYGNYRYHYDGDITVSMPNKPDFEPPVNPPVTPGTGTVTPLPEQPTNSFSNTPENTTETTGHKTVWDGDRGGDRPEDKRVVTLPFFKVLEDKTTHRYGTYDVAKRTTEVKIEPSAQVLPEPNQPATQYRELTTELTTDKGMGEFTLKYNGSRFTILPDDDAAMKLIVVGDETKNRALFEKALHVAFTQMGLEVADLDGVYIHFGKD